MNIIQIKIPRCNYNPNVITTKQGIVYHWTATKSPMDKLFQSCSRIGSAHYGIGDDGTIYQYVQDNQLAFHANFPNSKRNNNRLYIGIEHYGGFVDNGGRYKPSQACHKASIELSIYLAKKYGWKLERKKNAWKHGELGSTQCSGTLDVDYIVSEANKILNSNTVDTQLQDALNWNNEIKNKGLVRDSVQLVPSGNTAPLMDRVVSDDEKWLLVQLNELRKQIQSRPSLKNTKVLDETIKRYSQYFYSSLAV